jgi:hypothetical protein
MLPQRWPLTGERHFVFRVNGRLQNPLQYKASAPGTALGVKLGSCQAPPELLLYGSGKVFSEERGWVSGIDPLATLLRKEPSSLASGCRRRTFYCTNYSRIDAKNELIIVTS